MRWNRIKGRLKNFLSTDMDKQYLEEINYVLNEIENTDDRRVSIDDKT